MLSSPQLPGFPRVTRRLIFAGRRPTCSVGNAAQDRRRPSKAAKTAYGFDAVGLDMTAYPIPARSLVAPAPSCAIFDGCCAGSSSAPFCPTCMRRSCACSRSCRRGRPSSERTPRRYRCPGPAAPSNAASCATASISNSPPTSSQPLRNSRSIVTPGVTDDAYLDCLTATTLAALRAPEEPPLANRSAPLHILGGGVAIRHGAPESVDGTSVSAGGRRWSTVLRTAGRPVMSRGENQSQDLRPRFRRR